MPPVTYTHEPRPAAKLRAALERFKPILIDQIMLQMGWPAIGLRLSLKDVLVWCLVFCLAPR